MIRNYKKTLKSWVSKRARKRVYSIIYDSTSGGDGGSGVVILRYIIDNALNVSGQTTLQNTIISGSLNLTGAGSLAVTGTTLISA